MAIGGREWTGFYYDGRTARREPVTATVARDGVHLRRSDGSTIHWPFEGLRQTQGSFATERLRIEFGTDPVEALVVHQDGLPEAIGELAPGGIRRLAPRRHTAKIVGWSLAALALAGATYAAGAPILADWLAPKVPVEWEVGLGRSVVDGLAAPARRCGDSSGLASVRRIMDRLSAALPAASYDFHVFVVRDSQVNAFAAPGGFIVVNSGLLTAATTPEQLAGILAHEIQHVVHRHSTRALIREAPLRLALSALSGGSGIETAASALGTLGALSHRRGDEAEADRDGMQLLAAAHVDPREMVAFLRTLDAEHADAPKLVSYLSSHPHTADRITTLEGMISPVSPRTPLLDPVAWAHLRSMCSTTTR